jgi:hypothetical protein
MAANPAAAPGLAAAAPGSPARRPAKRRRFRRLRPRARPIEAHATARLFRTCICRPRVSRPIEALFALQPAAARSRHAAVAEILRRILAARQHTEDRQQELDILRVNPRGLALAIQAHTRRHHRPPLPPPTHPTNAEPQPPSARPRLRNAAPASITIACAALPAVRAPRSDPQGGTRSCTAAHDATSTPRAAAWQLARSGANSRPGGRRRGVGCLPRQRPRGARRQAAAHRSPHQPRVGARPLRGPPLP